MIDVDYHFSKLWFAAQNANWPLAAFYLNETKSHLNSAVRIRPVRNIAKLKSAIDAKDAKPFEAAYRQTMAECHACHKLAGKPYLRPRIPEAPATRIIDMKPGAN